MSNCYAVNFIRKMKYITVLLCVILCTNSSLGELRNNMRKFIENTVINITRVQTPAERDNRWRDFAVLDFVGLVQQYDGYTAEEYDVKTVDGYILKLHRITGSPYSPKAQGKTPVFIGHGLCLSSDMYVLLGPKQAMAFLLADAGYDVWVGNFRGNSYSRRHVSYSTSGNNYKFWNFSLDELALIDLPLFVDTILEKTNKQRLSYIGYSMGSTLSYIMLSSKPEYNNKINIVFNMAPVGIFTRPLSKLLKRYISIEPELKSMFVNRSIYRVLPQSKIFQILGKDVCGSKRGAFICTNLLKIIARVDQVDATIFPLVFSHVPSGSSLNAVDHYYQMMKSGKFAFYDHGEAINRAKYNAISPPEYDLSQISSPQAILYAEKDRYAGSRNSAELKKRLPNVVSFEEMPKNFTHLDFVMHPDARQIIYHRMLEILAQYS